MKKILTFGIVCVLALSFVTGCTFTQDPVSDGSLSVSAEVSE